MFSRDSLNLLPYAEGLSDSRTKILKGAIDASELLSRIEVRTISRQLRSPDFIERLMLVDFIHESLTFLTDLFCIGGNCRFCINRIEMSGRLN